jgi:hypothetical protein
LNIIGWNYFYTRIIFFVDQTNELELIYGLTRNMIKARKFGPIQDQVTDYTGEDNGWKAAIDRLSVALNLSARIAKKPIDQAVLRADLMANYRCPDRKAIFLFDLPPMLALSIKVEGIWRIGFGIITFNAIKNTIG